MKRSSVFLYLALLEFAAASSAFAADPVTPQPYLWSGWCDTQWSGFWWIFPLACIVMMVVMCGFMMRRGGISRMWCGDSAEKFGTRDSSTRSGSGPSPSALEILNERYAKGEIDKREYEEKRAAVVSSR